MSGDIFPLPQITCILSALRGRNGEWAISMGTTPVVFPLCTTVLRTPAAVSRPFSAVDWLTQPYYNVGKGQMNCS